jgi:hypothetical protein
VTTRRAFFADELHQLVEDAVKVAGDLPVSQWVADADRFATVIACGADSLFAEPAAAKKAKIKPAEVEQAIVEGLAILAHRPGGVTFAGHHWCVAEHLDCAGGGVCALPEQTLTRNGRGAFFTPADWAARLCADTIDVAVFVGSGRIWGIEPDEWVYRPSAEIGQLRVADPAVGSGALLVAAGRHLADRLAQAWQREAGIGPTDVDDTLRLAARQRAVGLLYGVDTDPLSVELARLAVSLLAPTSAVSVDQRIIVGDALVGFGNTDQLANGDPTLFPDGPTPLHWPLAFPEVFARDLTGFDVVVSNPPFLGGQKITGVLGKPYRDYLMRCVAGRTGSADLSAYFALRAHDLIHFGGSVGIIATNTLAQGDTREVGLDQLVDADHWQIWQAVKSTPWPGDASLHVCLVWTRATEQTRPTQRWPVRQRGVPAIPADFGDALVSALRRECRSTMTFGPQWRRGAPVEPVLTLGDADVLFAIGADDGPLIDVDFVEAMVAARSMDALTNLSPGNLLEVAACARTLRGVNWTLQKDHEAARRFEALAECRDQEAFLTSLLQQLDAQPQAVSAKDAA